MAWGRLHYAVRSSLGQKNRTPAQPVSTVLGKEDRNCQRACFCRAGGLRLTLKQYNQMSGSCGLRTLFFAAATDSASAAFYCSFTMY